MARPDTRRQILDTARRLWGEMGYNTVSMRDLAEAVGISVGNLTYHFPRKEAIMLALVDEMPGHYTPPIPPATLQELNAYFVRVLSRTRQDAFYFWHFTQMAQTFPNIQQKQAAILRQHVAALRQSFALLQASGLLQAECFPGQYAQLARAVRMVCIYWVPQSRLEEELDSESSFLQCVWAVLLGALTPKGLQVYQNEISPAPH